MIACCVCWTEGRSRQADPRFEGLPRCRSCNLESMWRARTHPPLHVPLVNPAAASDLQRYLFASAAR
jgi:hypothetical protein